MTNQFETDLYKLSKDSLIQIICHLQTNTQNEYKQLLIKWMDEYGNGSYEMHNCNLCNGDVILSDEDEYILRDGVIKKVLNEDFSCYYECNMCKKAFCIDCVHAQNMFISQHHNYIVCNKCIRH